MDWEIFRPTRATAVCFFLLTASFLFMTFHLTRTVRELRSFVFYWISPTQEAASSFLRVAGGLTSRAAEMVSAHRDNVILSGKLRDFALRELEYREAFSENVRLKKLLELKESYIFRSIPAQVSGRDTMNWMSSVWINRGTKDGVLPDSPVVAVSGSFAELAASSASAAGVVGRVLECASNSSKVLLISDPLSSIAVAVRRTGDQGLASGMGSFSISLEYLDPGADLRTGDEVVTSGLGGVFPAGLPVGKLDRILPSSSGFKNAALRPSAPLGRIREVLVLCRDSNEQE